MPLFLCHVNSRSPSLQPLHHNLNVNSRFTLHKNNAALGLHLGTLADSLSLPAERQPSPSLALNLPSNNPFRIRAASPASFNSLPSPQSPTFNINSAPPERSKNPFAEFIEVRDVSQSLQAPDSPRKAMPAIDDRISPKKQVLNESTVEIFVSRFTASGNHKLNNSNGTSSANEYAL